MFCERLMELLRLESCGVSLRFIAHIFGSSLGL